MTLYKAGMGLGKWWRPKPSLRRVAEDSDPYFLPNFCRGSAVAGVVIIAQMLAFVITLVTRRIFSNVFVDLLMISIFVQWVALASAAILCVTRKYLRKLPDARALLLVYLMLLCVTVILGEVGLWLAAAINLIGSPHPEWYSYFHVQNFAISAIINALALRYFLAKHELKQMTLSEARSKIEALQSRIRPTFLFNSMNAIASLTRSAPAKAEAAIEDMADVVRVMLGDAHNLVPVKNEIDVTKKYLSLETLRLEERLRVEWDVGKFPRTAVMPMLSLQPMLENVLYFGIEPSPLGGTVKIKMWEEMETLRINIATNLPLSGTSRPHKEQDAALENLRQRLDSYYGNDAQLEVIKDNFQYQIDVRFPARGGKV